MKNVLEWLEKSAEKYGDKTVYSNLEYSMTFNEVKKLAESIGTSLIAENLPEGPIAVVMDKEPKMIASYLGVDVDFKFLIQAFLAQPITGIAVVNVLQFLYLFLADIY